MIKTLIFLTFTLQLTSAETHSLKYFLTTVTPGISLSEFTAVSQVDEEQAEYYEYSDRKMVLKTGLLKYSEYEEHWIKMTFIAASERKEFKYMLAYLMTAFNQTKELHTLQKAVGCELDDDGSRRGYAKYGYDGEDFLSLDLNSGTWTAAFPQALPFIQSVPSMQGQKNFIQYECIDWLKMYVEYGKSVLTRKVPPVVSLFQKDPSSPVVCYATGFFPRAVMISWQKNGEDLNEDVDLRETLTNEDGTFQKRSILTVSPEELKNNNYTCEVHHSGLEKELVLQVAGREVLSGKSNGVSVGVIVGPVVVVLLLIIIVCGGVFIWKRKSSGVRPVAVSFRSDSPDSPSCSVAVGAQH